MTTTPRPPAVRIEGLRRRYGTGSSGFEAVRGVDLEVAAGTITALLGTNGAGKTSTLEVVEGLAPATEGRVEVLGLDPVADRGAVRRRTAVLLQTSGFSGDLTVRETLVMWNATVTDARSVEEVMDLVGMRDRADVAVRALSGGERRRLDLACTLTTRAEVVLLDEPTTGLDPESRRQVWRVLEDLRADGVTVLLCTHYLEEAEVLADHVAILHEGRIVRVGTVAEITAEAPSTIRFRHPEDTGLPDLPVLPGAGVTRHEGTVTVVSDDVQRDLGTLLAWAAEHGLRLDRLEARAASLESVFLDIAADRTDRTDRTDPEPEPEPEPAVMEETR
jgi:ABC-2 type transport system ATP-binding protein